MADRIVVVRTGNHLVSLPFDQIDEILGTDRIETAENLPEGTLPERDGDRYWVHSRGSWLPVGSLLPGSGVTSGSQIVVVRVKDSSRAFAVEEVLGIETADEMSPFPRLARPYTDTPIAGVRFWKEGPVLELDLSQLISLDLGS